MAAGVLRDASSHYLQLMRIRLNATLPRPHIVSPELKQYLLAFQNMRSFVEAGVSTEGPAAAYALVWEFGNLRQSKPGPKTVLGFNPVTGQSAFFSTQAPTGYVRVLVPLFRSIIDNEMRNISFINPNTAVLTAQLVKAAVSISKQMADSISKHAPVDSGDLAASIQPVLPGSDLLGTISQGA